MFQLFEPAFFGGGDTRWTPQLELISYAPRAAGEHRPLLFVHGAYAGAWCWEEHFLPYFAKRGFSAHALSLRGHGKSEGKDRLQSASLRDYVRDLAHTVESFDVAPVLIGHSMGGMVIQKYLEKYDAPAAVLMASVPPTGLAMPTLRLMMGDPWLLTQLSFAQNGSQTVTDLAAAKRVLFSAELPDHDLRRYIGRFRIESQRAIWDMTVADLPRRWLIDAPPMLVLGAEQDGLFAPSMVESTARTYGGTLEIFRDMGHAMMLEPNWLEPADRIVDWLNELGL